MARPAKSVVVNRKKMSIDDINKRLESEVRLRGQTDSIKPPSFLNAAQKKIFKYIVKNLDSSGILGNLDIYVLAQTAITIDRIQECEKNINENGLIDHEGKPNPAVKIKDSYMKEFFRMCNELCLSPQSRAKLANMNLKAEADEEDEFLKAIRGDF